MKSDKNHTANTRFLSRILTVFEEFKEPTIRKKIMREMEIIRTKDKAMLDDALHWLVKYGLVGRILIGQKVCYYRK